MNRAIAIVAVTASVIIVKVAANAAGAQAKSVEFVSEADLPKDAELITFYVPRVPRQESLTEYSPRITSVEPASTVPTGVGPAYERAPELAQRLIAEHWPASEWEHAALIGECESGWIATAHNSTGEDSRGWFQINIGPGANTDMRSIDLYDPVENVRVAGIIWRRQGWRAWLNCARKHGITNLARPF